MSAAASTPKDTNDSDQNEIQNEFDIEHNDNDNGDSNEFDIDKMTSIDQLANLLLEINGPPLTPGLSLSDAKDEVWAYVEETAPDDIDDMCMQQLSSLAEELAPGVELPDDGKGIEGVRDFVWDLADRAAHVDDGACDCPDCGVKYGPRG